MLLLLDLAGAGELTAAAFTRHCRVLLFITSLAHHAVLQAVHGAHSSKSRQIAHHDVVEAASPVSHNLWRAQTARMYSAVLSKATFNIERISHCHSSGAPCRALHHTTCNAIEWMPSSCHHACAPLIQHLLVEATTVVHDAYKLADDHSLTVLMQNVRCQQV
jgi:hypothetical protein